jgi:electron transfer flavoprotein beta subunit
MRIVVTIKQILDPAGVAVNRRRERIFVNREEYVISPTDKLALEAALRLKDEYGAEVAALSLGPARGDDALREALAMGADSAFLLSGGLLDHVDAAGAARALARAIEQIGECDLVLAGQMSGDTGGEEIGSRLAELLSLPQILEVIDLRLDGGELEVVRRWNGQSIVARCGLPALAAIAPGARPARRPHGARIMNAYREWSVTTWTADDLGLTEDDLAPLVESRGESFPAERERGQILTGSPAEMAGDVVAQWRERRLL